MDEVCKAMGRPYLKLLENSGDARVQQKRLNRAQRLESSSGRFVINPKYEMRLPELKDRRIIVVDDMVTTMSTMKSAIGFLKENGFSVVCGASWLCEL